MVMYLGKVVEIGPVEPIYGNPQHPYTRALLSARPSMDPAPAHESADFPAIRPIPINPPSGCRFRTRCPFAEAVCAEREPPLTRRAGDHLPPVHAATPGSGHSLAATLN